MILTLLLMKKEENELAKTRAMVQAIIKNDAGPEAWESYFKTAFPWIEVAKTREKDNIIEILKKEVSRGPMAVKATNDGTKQFRSRLKTKVVSREEANRAARLPLGRLIPVGDRRR